MKIDVLQNMVFNYQIVRFLAFMSVHFFRNSASHSTISFCSTILFLEMFRFNSFMGSFVMDVCTLISRSISFTPVLEMLSLHKVIWASLNCRVLQNYATSLGSNLGSSVIVRNSTYIYLTAFGFYLNSLVSILRSSARMLSFSSLSFFKYSSLFVMRSHDLP